MLPFNEIMCKNIVQPERPR